MEEQKIAANEEDPAPKAKILAEKLRSRLRETIAHGGGSGAFLQWLRSTDENSAPKR
jgi:hypothetical protein